MSALPSNVVDFKIPKRPRVKEKDLPPDRRKASVVPIRALSDRKLTEGSLRALLAICSYTNRAGITWVSQAKIAHDLGISQQAVSKQILKLKEFEYIEVVKKGFKGQSNDTIRVIFDKDIDAETAISIASLVEDSRTPLMREKQDREQEKAREQDFTEEQLAINRERIRNMLTGSTTGNTTTHQARRIGDILMPKQKQLKAVHTQPQEVVNGDNQTAQKRGTHTQPYTQPSEVVKYEEERVKAVIYKVFNKHSVSSVQPLSNLKLSDAELTSICETLSNRYQSEGVAVPASDDQLIYDLLMISTDLLEAGAYTTHSAVPTSHDHA
jgi:predicted transcriptional regulator